MYLIWEYLASVLIALLIALVLFGFSLLFLVAKQWAQQAPPASQHVTKRLETIAPHQTHLAHASQVQNTEHAR